MDTKRNTKNEGQMYLNFKDTWESFCEKLKWRSRFFSIYAETDLRSIFGDLHL